MALHGHGSVVTFSLDTGTRESVLTINGVIITTNDVLIEKYEFDGEQFLRFSYTIESINSDGMTERRQFFLPSPEELATKAHGDLNEAGFASKIVYDDEKAKADVIKFLQHDRNKS